jgi:hypothetical protein
MIAGSQHPGVVAKALKDSNSGKILAALNLVQVPIKISETPTGVGGIRSRGFKDKNLAVVLVTSIKDPSITIAISTIEVITHIVGLIGSNTIVRIMVVIIGEMVVEGTGMLWFEVIGILMMVPLRRRCLVLRGKVILVLVLICKLSSWVLCPLKWVPLNLPLAKRGLTKFYVSVAS